MRAHFESCGRILFIRFAADEAGNPRGFCHVIFEDDPQEPKKALNAALALHGSTLLERTISVGPAEEKPKPKKAQKAPKRPVDETGEVVAKKPRPAEWRHDRAAGLTLPRKKQPWQGS